MLNAITEKNCSCACVAQRKGEKGEKNELRNGIGMSREPTMKSRE